MTLSKGCLLALLVLSAPMAEAATSSDSQTPSTSPTTDSAGITTDTETQDDQLRVYEEVEVRERADDLVGIATSATEGSTGREDLAKRPILRAGELLETTPGIVATQHSGGGKGNQFFVRGFNLDHGTDFSIRVAGVPVNMPTHGHGQGYADLSFLIPEVVDRVRYRKGPYYADVGDFSAAGTVDMDLVRSLPEGILTLTGGSYDYGRALWADSFEHGDRITTVALEGFHEDGPWTRGNGFDGFKAMARLSGGDARRGHTLTFMGYAADWLSTDQIPLRAVESGLIGPFDLVDEGPSGKTDRFSLSGQWFRGSDKALTQIDAYMLYYDFDLVSNFTYFLEDAENGDQFEQKDRRWATGLDVSRSWLTSWGGRTVETNVGIDSRFDHIENGLFRTRELERFDTVREDTVDQARLALWADASVQLSSKVQARFGLRADSFYADVESDLAINSGDTDDALLSPKLSFIFGPWNNTEVYLNLGYGFHSNDARGSVLVVDPSSGELAAPVEPLVRGEGADLGFRTSPKPGWQMTFTAFILELDSELVFVGDGGATEANNGSQRYGIEWTNFYQVNSKVALDLDVTLTEARFTGDTPDGDEIPGAVGTTVAAGINFDNVGKFFGSLRLRHFGDIPLIEDGSVEWDSTSLVNARLGYRLTDGLDLSVDVFNLLDSDDSDIQYFYASRLPGEPEGGFEDVHFHPVEPRSARVTLTWRR